MNAPLIQHLAFPSFTQGHHTVSKLSADTGSLFYLMKNLWKHKCMKILIQNLFQPNLCADHKKRQNDMSYFVKLWERKKKLHLSNRLRELIAHFIAKHSFCSRFMCFHQIQWVSIFFCLSCSLTILNTFEKSSLQTPLFFAKMSCFVLCFSSWNSITKLGSDHISQPQVTKEYKHSANC